MIRGKNKSGVGRMAREIKREIERARDQKIVSLAKFVEEQAVMEKAMESVPLMTEQIAEGRDPAFAIYTNTVNLMGVLTEGAEGMPAFSEAMDFLGQGDDMYVPGYPPMSPITTSYFTFWSLFDVPFGKGRETIGDCWASTMEAFNFHPAQREAARNLCQSRMGIYEVVRASGQQGYLRELVTNNEIEVHVPNGCEEITGSLILLRLAPPLENCPIFHVGITTPYVLTGYEKQDWLDYFQRQKILPGTPGVERRLYQHMKFGKDRWYWSEFIFHGYTNHRSDVIFLAGMPDQPKTQPHHPKYCGKAGSV